ncbi:MAG: hypothetical protein QOF24_2172 [Verrucomicrobiota bacterium]|jgi:hypothetical protein
MSTSSPKREGVRTPFTAKLSIVVAVISLAVASLNPYFTSLAPFGPLVTSGGPVFQFGTATPANLAATQATGPEFDPQPNRVLAGILLPVVFTHEGGRPGVISDIALRVSRSGDNDRWMFEPILFVDERAFLTSFDSQAHLKWIEAAFSPIALGRGQQIKRFILFQGNEHPHYPAARLRVGRYTINVLVRLNNAAIYDTRERIDVDFSRDVLGNLDAAKYAPPPESVMTARTGLK